VSLAALNYQAAHELFKRNSQSTQIIINVTWIFSRASLYAPPNEIQERSEIIARRDPQYLHLRPVIIPLRTISMFAANPRSIERGFAAEALARSANRQIDLAAARIAATRGDSIAAQRCLEADPRR
jgi:hypothetical protein